ncbi:MAG: response regulator transcription factor [Gammaproteobacteria bacterium]|nr:response regulator transcription factor [Gammaproteobacteria bacterium]
MHKILLIDDDERLAELLGQYFQRFELRLDSALRPSEGLKRLSLIDYDLVILDVMLPEMDGFEVCKRIRKDNNIPIIMLTARGDVMDRVVGLELGADDYLPKPFEPRELVARIQSIIKRAHGQRTNTLCFGKLKIDTKSKTASLSETPLSLSSMEFQLLELLANRAGETLSRDDILNQLKGVEGDILTRSVDIAISRLRQKLKPLDVIKTVRGSGYLFTGAPS